MKPTTAYLEVRTLLKYIVHYKLDYSKSLVYYPTTGLIHNLMSVQSTCKTRSSSVITL